jgi:putative ATPase
MADPTLFDGSGSSEPLASRLRPRTLDEFVGQKHLLDPGKPLRQAIERGEVPSLIFWGPPGSGKTTLAFLIARHTNKHFEPFSAVTEGVPRVREIIREARERRRLEGRGTILFCDEIHRFNRAQQDAFLPSVEGGVITLIGATTENPSFELTGALLSRAQVYVLEPLGPEDLRKIVERGLRETGKGTGEANVGEWVSPEAIELLVQYSDGDARRALNAIEALDRHVATDPSRFAFPISRELLEGVLAKRLPKYDKSGEEHFNLISALHKAVRGSDPQGALYWLARILHGGEDPMFVARRLVRMASEDIGLADPAAVAHAIAARDAFHFLGSPEGELALAEITVYLATAPKSNRVYLAWRAARAAAEEFPAAPVPLHIRNAPTALMKGLGYGKGYRYAFDDPAAYVPQRYLPDVLGEAIFYEPGTFGHERRIAERMAWWRARAEPGSPTPE